MWSVRGRWAHVVALMLFQLFAQYFQKYKLRGRGRKGRAIVYLGFCFKQALCVTAVWALARRSGLVSMVKIP